MEPLTATDGTQIWPSRKTAIRCLRKGDRIVAPVGPNTAVHATVDHLEEHESSRIIIVHAHAPNGEPFSKKSRPWELVDRLAQPGDRPPGRESRMVRGDELWKWLNVPLNDPEGSDRQYILRSCERIQDKALGDLIRIKMQSGDIVNTSDVFCDATFSFVEHR